MWRRLLAILPVAATAPILALAASVALTSAGLGAGSATSPRCVTSDLTVIQNISGSNVASVTVATLPSGCGGATIQLTVNNGSTTGSGSATVPVGGGSVTVTLSPTLAASTVEQTDFVLVGP